MRAPTMYPSRGFILSLYLTVRSCLIYCKSLTRSGKERDVSRPHLKVKLMKFQHAYFYNSNFSLIAISSSAKDFESCGVGSGSSKWDSFFLVGFLKRKKVCGLKELGSSTIRCFWWKNRKERRLKKRYCLTGDPEKKIERDKRSKSWTWRNGIIWPITVLNKEKWVKLGNSIRSYSSQMTLLTVPFSLESIKYVSRLRLYLPRDLCPNSCIIGQIWAREGLISLDWLGGNRAGSSSQRSPNSPSIFKWVKKKVTGKEVAI